VAPGSGKLHERVEALRPDASHAARDVRFQNSIADDLPAFLTNPFVMGPGAWTSVGRALREPAGRVHWAGTETATRWAGFIDGAVSSGERVGVEALAAL